LATGSAQPRDLPGTPSPLVAVERPTRRLATLTKIVAIILVMALVGIGVYAKNQLVPPGPGTRAPGIGPTQTQIDQPIATVGVGDPTATFEIPTPTFEIPPVVADLVPMSCYWSEGPPTVTIVNQGQGTAGPATIGLEASDGSVVYRETRELPPGASLEFTFDARPLGEGPDTVIVDATGVVNEANEGNNRLECQYVVG
jgi:hypothetical protein